jgi:ADP-heptose:LPS heptosyltransferase
VPSVLEELPPGGRVAIIRLRSLGDCVLTTPALGILKNFRRDLRVAVVVEDRFRAIFEEHPDVDALLPPETAALRRWRPALCLNLHGGTRSAWLAAASGARHRAGFVHFRFGFVYNLLIPRAQEVLGVERTVHTAEHLASAIFWLGAPEGETPRARLSGAQRAPQGAPRVPHQPIAVIHAVAAAASKTWRADGFLAVAEHLRAGGLEPVFIGAAADDLSPFSRYRTLRGAPLDELRRLLASASLFVGNDSGPAHMAAALGLPVVVIFGASDPAIWSPWRTASEVVRAPGGIAQVETAQVLDALARLRVHA